MKRIAELLNIDDTKMNYEREVVCYQCGASVPVSQATIQTIEVESGRRGASATLHGWDTNYTGKYKNGTPRRTNKRSKGISYNLGATYYRQQKVAICDDCAEANHLAYLARRKRRRIFLAVVGLMIASVFVYHKMNAPENIVVYEKGKVNIQSITKPIEIFK